MFDSCRESDCRLIECKHDITWRHRFTTILFSMGIEEKNTWQRSCSTGSSQKRKKKTITETDKNRKRTESPCALMCPPSGTWFKCGCEARKEWDSLIETDAKSIISLMVIFNWEIETMIISARTAWIYDNMCKMLLQSYDQSAVVKSAKHFPGVGIYTVLRTRWALEFGFVKTNIEGANSSKRWWWTLKVAES